MSLNNSTSKDDENFLKEFLKGFYHHGKFEIVLTEWIKDFLHNNKKSSKMILKFILEQAQ